MSPTLITFNTKYKKMIKIYFSTNLQLYMSQKFKTALLFLKGKHVKQEAKHLSKLF